MAPVGGCGKVQAVSRSLPALSLALLIACTAKPPATVAVDTTTPRTSVTMGGSLVVPRFVATWSRPSRAHAGQVEGLVMQRGGPMQYVNVCDMRGISWRELPGDTLALTSVNGSVTAPAEQHYHIVELSDSALELAGDGFAAGRWVRTTAGVAEQCPAP